MESSCPKYYHTHNFSSREFLDTYLCADSVIGEEALTFPLEKLHQVFEKEHINGDLLIDISAASAIHLLLSASDCFKEILLLRLTDSCILELNRWLHNRTGAFCWKHTTSFVAEKQGTSDLCEMQLKNKVRHVIKCNLEEENITDPVETPKGDCVITACLLDVISTNQNYYLRYLRKILKCLKPGGTLILLGVLNATYFTNSGERFHVFTYDRGFVCSALVGEKLVIAECEVFPRKVKTDLCDFGAVIFILAYKEK
ncbi:nicotinamide N-methyltransferase-like [Gastrophryne carolinensis]